MINGVVRIKAMPSPWVVQLWWPQNGAQLCGDTFTWRGLVDDFTATLTAEVVDASGNTNYGTAEIERDGKFWFEDLSLPDGTSTVTSGLMHQNRPSFGCCRMVAVVTLRQPTAAW